MKKMEKTCTNNCNKNKKKMKKKKKIFNKNK